MTENYEPDDLSWVDAIGNVRVRFWVCPIEGHSDRTDDRGGPVLTVDWRDDVAYCTMPGCGYNSARTTNDG